MPDFEKEKIEDWEHEVLAVEVWDTGASDGMGFIMILLLVLYICFCFFLLL